MSLDVSGDVKPIPVKYLSLSTRTANNEHKTETVASKMEKFGLSYP